MKIEKMDYIGTITDILDSERCNPLGTEGSQISESIFAQTKDFQDEIYSVCKNHDDYLTAEAAVNSLVLGAQDIAFEYGFKKAIHIMLDAVRTEE